VLFELKMHQSRNLAKKAQLIFENASPYAGPALLNHNLRIAWFTMALGKLNNISLDQDLIFAACHIHDFGLFFLEPAEPSYLKRSWRFIKKYLIQWKLTLSEMAIFRDVLYYNHSFHSVKRRCLEADLVRKAVEVEHSYGIAHNGLGPSFYKSVEKKFPRLNLTGVLVDFARITFIEDGVKMLFPMFWPNF
jgi:hypothetical protein